ncbi:group II intron reverse transcriptase/maturase (plasmid) [Bradyrhizobium septentrionale]|jgi:RNA-directed DNA polymerase|uniref:Group II intron reverse transcriptase/maturase n=1 Tax=Bradyrhizobium septentrionale TaxID=1404411 RepID=A0A973WAF5_9BRAD|nr:MULTISPECIES: group II intron reverse transcriptase/maturase [Bradyrhizobium]MCK7664458.1 group II intron reverse transcriptase/maturase [Bradyrhizobium sp. 2S1]MCK7664662.1 group II intron reverse transcriptase/maturase [Bradyrhizobium sp. 2S1]MCK7664710.1 group II intron reverse transcriptase/maturase [Bradyrhizobium sp. 2S1]MCK7664715.1 group II intron reverse transcriptase/maturase [Bradyrhizobium sp. 2S1]MCK7664822.1 group II intron reverse transcriptase/maturase [Bradyrhizobium sp. 2S
MSEAKPYDISKHLVWQAWKQVKANQGAAGVDGVSVAAFEKDLKRNLYKVWNRMSSGTYFPPPVRLVEIPKSDGKSVRKLGIPAVGDRVAQTVAKMVIEKEVEPVFHPDSYGYRPGRSALDAVGKARERCWKFDWVIDLDIKSFFDTIPWDLMEKAVAHHVELGWVRLYVRRWLQATVERKDGTRDERTRGTPQGSVVSPVLSNLFMHYCFDAWMQRTFSHLRFERFADDAIVHCWSEEEAKAVLGAIRNRLAECGLELHPEKTRIVYCKDNNRSGGYEQITFDFLGYTFRPRKARDSKGEKFVSFAPAISRKAAKGIRQAIREWRVTSRSNQTLEDLAKLIDPVARGWLNYYGRFYRSECVNVLRHVNMVLTRWVMGKYKRFKRRKTAAISWLGRLAKRAPSLLYLWKVGIRPTAG